MKQKLIFFLEVTAKNAVNAILTNAGLMGLFPTVFHTHDKVGLINIGYATLVAIAVREGQIWGPVVLKWSSSPTVVKQVPAVPPPPTT